MCGRDDQAAGEGGPRRLERCALGAFEQLVVGLVYARVTTPRPSRRLSATEESAWTGSPEWPSAATGTPSGVRRIGDEVRDLTVVRHLARGS